MVAVQGAVNTPSSSKVELQHLAAVVGIDFHGPRRSSGRDIGVLFGIALYGVLGVVVVDQAIALDHVQRRAVRVPYISTIAELALLLHDFAWPSGRRDLFRTGPGPDAGGSKPVR